MPYIPAQLTLGLGDMNEKAEELRERKTAWKKKSWNEFCKLVMEADKRFTILPLSDYHARVKASGMDIRVTRAEGLFSNFCLRREGTLTDVFILPNEPALGIRIDTGSKFITGQLTCFPSKTLVWVAIRMADEFERQYVREVTVQANKVGVKFGGTPTGQGVVAKKVRRKYDKRANANTSGHNSNELPPSKESD